MGPFLPGSLRRRSLVAAEVQRRRSPPRRLSGGRPFTGQSAWSGALADGHATVWTLRVALDAGRDDQPAVRARQVRWPQRESPPTPNWRWEHPLRLPLDPSSSVRLYTGRCFDIVC